MRSALDPHLADEIFQHACAAGEKAADEALERHLLVAGESGGCYDVAHLVAEVVNAALQEAGRRMVTLIPGNPCPPGATTYGYITAVNDATHVLGACEHHRSELLALRHARRK